MEWLHLNVTQDIGHGVAIIFVCCILVIAACLIDLQSGIDAAKKNKEQIRSRILRKTILKITDYLRIVIFGVLIDILGLCFPWYSIPYCAVLATLCVLLIEGKSVIENYKKTKSAARKVIDMAEKIVSCADNETAQKIISALKEEHKEYKHSGDLSE